MFQFRRFPSRTYLIQYGMTRSSRAAFPHSEIHGSKPICGSPWLIAACHVLLRLLMPRHPPCALLRLTSVKLENHASHSVTQNRSLPFYGFSTIFIASSVALLALSSLPLFSFQGAAGSLTGVCEFQELTAPLRIEAAQSTLESWWAQVDSNHRPYDYQSYALTS